MKSGFVSIVGRPNVGKSTLINALVGEKVAITADKPQTTRNRIRGILNDAEAQIVFIDTPGLAKPRNKLGEYMAEQALQGMGGVDIILFIVNEPLSEKGGDRYIFERLASAELPKILVINKIDLIEPAAYKEIYDSYEKEGIFQEIIGISALNGDNIPPLLSAIKNKLAEGPAYFPNGLWTDMPERFLTAEIIREKALRYLDDEVPHGVAVEIESFEEKKGLVSISAVLYAEKKSHKAIIIGKDGRKLKGIGKSAREDIEALLDTKVFLKLWVKIKENWRDADFLLSSFGYSEKKER